jgi:hypothetical protein
MGATCTAAQTHMHPQRRPSQEFDRNGAKSGGVDALPSEWRPWLRSDRLLGSPGADRQSFGCSPAIEGISIQHPPKQARFSDHMSGRGRSSTLATKLGEPVADVFGEAALMMELPRRHSTPSGGGRFAPMPVADSFRTNGKCAQTIRMINAAAASRFPAASRAGRAAPATYPYHICPLAGFGASKRREKTFT